MASKYMSLGILAAAVAVLPLEAGAAEAQTPSAEVAQVMKRLDTLGHMEANQTTAEKYQKLRDLEELGNTVRTQFGDTNPEGYARLTVRICGTIQALGIINPRKEYLAQHYAMTALEKRAGFSLDAQCELVRNLQQDVDAQGKTLTGDARADLRKQQAALWLETWNRVVTSIDKNWAPQDRPSTVLPPEGVALEEGGAPELIGDPKLRAEYVAAIEANRRKSAEYWAQSRARKLQKRWIPGAKRFLIRSYMEAPERTEELQALLEQYVTDAKDRAQVLDAVKNKKMPEELEFRITTQKADAQPPQTQPAQ